MSEDSILLSEIATARSGDKGNHANIGVVAKSELAYQILREVLTADFLRASFFGLGVTRVERYELPKVRAFNFVLYDALSGGASQSLRLDTQGKLLGTAAMQLRLPVDDLQRQRLRSDSRQQNTGGVR